MHNENDERYQRWQRMKLAESVGMSHVHEALERGDWTVNQPLPLTIMLPSGPPSTLIYQPAESLARAVKLGLDMYKQKMPMGPDGQVKRPPPPVAPASRAGPMRSTVESSITKTRRTYKAEWSLDHEETQRAMASLSPAERRLLEDLSANSSPLSHKLLALAALARAVETGDGP